MRRWPRSAHGSAATCLAATERKLNEIAAATRFRTWLPRRRQRDAANPTGFEAHCAWVRLRASLADVYLNNKALTVN